MFVVALGYVTGDASYTDKKTGEHFSMLDVVVDNQTFRVSVDDVADFCQFDEVVISGDLRVFERRMYFDQAKCRLAEASDGLLFVQAGRRTLGTRRNPPPVQVAAAPTIPKDK